MNLDIQTLFVMMLANVFTVSLALPALMGWRVSRAARFAQGSGLVQAIGWACFLVARALNDRLFSTLWIGCLGLSFVLLWRALELWLGPRPARGWLLPLALLTPLGYGLGFEHYAFRVGWSNFGLALLMMLVCLALVAPAPQGSWRWRGLILASVAALAGVTAWRGVLGAFFTELYPYLRAPHPVNVAAAVLNHVALTMTTIGALAAWREEAERELKFQAETDGLTGLMNRPAFLARAEDMLALARRHRDKLSLLLIDLDHFKQINDRGGHAAGDRALQLFAHALRLSLRRGDLVCRYGGEEFCVLLARSEPGARALFDARLRAALREQIRREEPQAPDFSFSAGGAVFDAQDDSLDALLRRADAALYRAKEGGRGRLVEDEGVPLLARVA
ncbi:GGDEF domain-containing protein [Caldimonas tepidiphila]|uniref:GGDEF domain-containing protein n=1 Tax=Caldimonas tepidiphila TaxID=2315841 RepID=UPI000E5B077B|nr:GGDEF domain-containing protein [Caldimonas tepidiphila]